jgi:hypothetical protein
MINVATSQLMTCSFILSKKSKKTKDPKAREGECDGNE